MKGVILAGGFGNRLKPLTEIVNKHLLPVYDKPVIYYPIQTLLNLGIRDILVVTGPDHAGGFMKLLGSGAKLGCNFYFAVQEDAGGIAQAMARAEEFVGQDSVAVILGDNIFEENFSHAVEDFKEGGMVFLKDVHDPERFGVVEFDEARQINRIVEKPELAPSPYAVTGLYFYDHHVFDIIRTLKPSARGELEVTDVNNAYIQKNAMRHVIMTGSWSDMGTFESLYEASTIARSMALRISKESPLTHRSLHTSLAGVPEDALHDA